MPPETVEAYTTALRSLDYDDCRAACAELVLDSRWLPAVSDITAATRHAGRTRRAAEQRAREEAREAEYDRRAIPPPPEALAAMRRLGLPQETTSNDGGTP